MKNTLLTLVFLATFSSATLTVHAQSQEYPVRNYELRWDNAITLGEVRINVDEDPQLEEIIQVHSITVATCIQKRSDLHSAAFSTRINCNYILTSALPHVGD